MAIRRDRTNQFGYVCPTENEAVWNADHPQRDMQIKRYRSVMTDKDIQHQGVQRTEAQKKLDSLSEYVEQMGASEPKKETKADAKLKKMRNIYMIISNICVMENVKINGIQLHYSGDSTVYTKKELS